MTKVWWKSKTFWTNILGAVGIFASSHFGISWTPETTASILIVLNLILRAVTKEKLVWTTNDEQ